MDPDYSLQDVIRCNLCETPDPPLYCKICHINLCKGCAGEHLLDECKFHIVVPIKHRQLIPKYNCSKCQIHSNKLCELHCEQCDIPVCIQCVSSKKHKAHDVVDVLSYLEKKNKSLQADLEELGQLIYPIYQEIASSFPVQKADLNRNTEKLISAIMERGEDWHREIDDIIRKMIFDIKEKESRHRAVLQKQEEEINYAISDITENIGELKKLLDSNDACLLSKYISRNAEFKRLPPKQVISLPKFTSESIDTKELFQLFGSVSALSITTEERLYTKETLGSKFLHSNITHSCQFDYDEEETWYEDALSIEDNDNIDNYNALSVEDNDENDNDNEEEQRNSSILEKHFTRLFTI